MLVAKIDKEGKKEKIQFSNYSEFEMFCKETSNYIYEVRSEKKDLIKAEEELKVFWGLAIYIKSGINIVTAIKYVLNDFNNTNLQEIKRDIENGESIYKSFKNRFEVMDFFMKSQLMTADETGNYEKAFFNIIKYMDNKKTNRKKIIRIIYYPSVVIIMLTLVIAFALNIYFPRIIDSLMYLNPEVVSQTQGIYFYRNVFDLVIAVVALIFVFTWLCWEKVKYKVMRKLYKLRLFRELLDAVYLEAFSFVLVELINTGYSINKALRTIYNDKGFYLYNRQIYEAINIIESGGNICKGISKISLFSQAYMDIMNSGETSGRFTESLMLIHDINRKKLKKYYEEIPQILEPLIIAVVGAIIGFFIYFIYKQYFNLIYTI